MRALVTGASGFVGRHLVEALRRDGADVLGCSGPNDVDGRNAIVDLGDERTLEAALERFCPTVVFHLAAQTSVPDSLSSPLATYETNVMGTARLARAVRACEADARPRIVFASSATVYGNRSIDEYPLAETLDLRPADPYAASKAAAEAILLAESRGLGLDVVIARAFNQIGPGQDERFVVSSFAAQLARIAGGGPPVLRAGNLAAARDFLDVRDAVQAYLALARDGENGQIYNVCTGRAIAIRDVLRELIGIARVAVEVREDPQRMRGAESPLSVGAAEKIRALTGWEPRIPLLRSLRDVYEAARQRAAGR